MDPTQSADTRTYEEWLDAARNRAEGALAVLVERPQDRLKRLNDVFQRISGGIKGTWG
jgi:hypothetical protein